MTKIDCQKLGKFFALKLKKVIRFLLEEVNALQWKIKEAI